jgi:DNA-binding CsgD family transcriptional regulator
MDGGVMSKLTNRQREIVRLLAAGCSQKEAARRLGIAYGTVRKHTLAARTRADCRSTIEIVARAVDEERV